MNDTVGVVEAILVYPQSRGAPVPLAETEALAGAGLRGDRRRFGERQITLLAREDWERAGAELRRSLPPETRRANLVVSGVPLARAIGRRVRVGEAVLRIGGETKPCARMDEAAAGLRAALEPERRGGVFGVVEVGGRIARGDPVRLLPPGSEGPAPERPPAGRP